MFNLAQRLALIEMGAILPGFAERERVYVWIEPMVDSKASVQAVPAPFELNPPRVKPFLIQQLTKKLVN
jgi:hypothetical protein